MIVEHPINELKNHISGWYIDTILCDEILAECTKKKILFEKEQSGFRGYSSTYLHLLSKKLHESYVNILDQCLQNYKSQYTIFSNLPQTRYQRREIYKDFATCTVQKYQPGKHYSELHCENDGAYPYRVLAFMTYLCDIDGGGTDFPMQNFQPKSEKGLTLIWPASFTHPHIGIPAANDTKIIITGWFEWDM